MLLNASQFDDDQSSFTSDIRIDWYDVWPLPVELIENLQRENYWASHVAKFGREAFKSYKVIGRRVKRGNHPEGVPISTDAYREWATTKIDEQSAEDGDDRETVKRYYVWNYLRVQHGKAVTLKSDRNDVDVYDEWKRTKGEYAAVSNSQKCQNIEKRYEELRKSVERRETETENQRLIPKNRLLGEDDSGYESAEERKTALAAGRMEEEELDSDEEMRICAEFMFRRR
jgi:hypothetical protein